MNLTTHRFIAVLSLVGSACALVTPREGLAAVDRFSRAKEVSPPAAPTLAVLTHAVLDYATRTGNGTLIENATWSAGTSAHIRSSLPERGSFYFEVENPYGGSVAVGLTTGAANKPFFELDSQGKLNLKSSPKTNEVREDYSSWSKQKVGIAWNADTKEVLVYYNGVRAGKVMYANVSGPVYPTVYSNGGTIKINLGQDGFGNRVPKGFRPGSYLE